MATPNYLGFTALEPKESALERAFSSGTQAYGELTKLQTEKAESQIAQEKAKVAPDLMKQAVAKGQQDIDIGAQTLAQEKTKTQYLPGELEQKKKMGEQQIGMNDIMLKYMPEKMRASITGEQLDNMGKRITNQVNSLSYDQQKENYLNNKMADIDDYQGRPDVQERLWQDMLKHGSALGVDTSYLPKHYSSEAQSFVNSATQKTAAGADIRKFHNDVYLQNLKDENQLKVEQWKTLHTPSEWQKKEDEENSKYATEVAEAAKKVQPELEDTRDLYITATNNPGKLGVISGRMLKFTDGGRQLDSIKSKVVNDMYFSADKLGRAGTALLKSIESSKVDATMPIEAAQKLTALLHTGAALVAQKNQYWNTMKNEGINDRNDLEGSWDNFVSANPLMDEKGNVHPENAYAWPEYFKKNTQALPIQVQKKMGVYGKAPTAGAPVVSQGVATTPGGTAAQAPEEAKPQYYPSGTRVGTSMQGLITPARAGKFLNSLLFGW